MVYAINGTKGHLNWGVHDTISRSNVVQFDTEAECYAWIDGCNYALVVNR